MIFLLIFSRFYAIISRMATRKRKTKKTSRGKKRRKMKKGEGLFLLCILLVISLGFLYLSGVRPRAALNTVLSSANDIAQAIQSELPFEEQRVSPTSAHSALADKSDTEISPDLPIGLQIPLCKGSHAVDTGKEMPTGHEVHSYEGFSLCYREEYEQAEWVAYCITKDELVKTAERSNDFHADSKISTGSATPEDYTRSGYDRGHLAPAADMSFSKAAMHDSFNMSNMSPQAPQFNRGIWKNLEEQVRKWVNTFGSLYVVSGPILDKDAYNYKAIGKNQVAVPEYYYKVLLTKAGDRVIAVAFILPNDKDKGSIWDYAVSVDEVEERTGLDFFYLLDDAREKAAEKAFSPLDWN